MGSTQIAVVGPAGAGKTTLVQRLMGQSPTATTPTIGFNVRKFNYRGVELLVTDLGGQQAFVNEFWEQMLSKADGIIFVMDAAAPNLFAMAYDLFLFVLPRMNNVPMVVLANKQDLPQAATVQELSKLFDFKSASRRFGITALEIFPISALTGEGVKRAIDWLTNEIVLSTGGELPTVTSIYVYQTQTGIPLAIGKDIFVEDGDDVEDNLVDLSKEPGLVTAFYSALSAFANEIIHANVQSLHLRNPDPTRSDYILFNCVDSRAGEIGCLIVAKNDGNETLLEILAERIIDEVLQRSDELQNEGPTQLLIDITNLVRKIARDFVKTKQIIGEDERESFEWARLLDKRLQRRVPGPVTIPVLISESSENTTVPDSVSEEEIKESVSTEDVGSLEERTGLADEKERVLSPTPKVMTVNEKSTMASSSSSSLPSTSGLVEPHATSEDVGSSSTSSPPVTPRVMSSGTTVPTESEKGVGHEVSSSRQFFSVQPDEIQLTPSRSRIDQPSPTTSVSDDDQDDEYYRYFRRLSVAERVKEIERRRRQRAAARR